MTTKTPAERAAMAAEARRKGMIQFSELLKFIRFTMRVAKYDYIIAIVGRKRTVKSTMAKRIMKNLDPNYATSSRLVYTGERFLEEWNKEPPPFSWYCYDDASNGLSSDEWQQLESKIFGKIAEMGGSRYAGIILTLPTFKRLSPQVRGQVNIVIRTDGRLWRRGFATVKAVKESDNLTRPKLLYPWLRFKNRKTGYRFNGKRPVYVRALPEDEYSEYDAEKTASHRVAYREMEEKLKAKNAPRSRSDRSPAQLEALAKGREKRWANQNKEST